jgi:hypothetical protein
VILLLAAALPSLFWEAGPGAAPAMRKAGISHISVPAAQVESWKDVAGVAVEPADPGSFVKMVAPGVDYRADQASASRAPWLNSNGWRFLRQPAGRFYYDAPGKQAALAAAEAFSYGASATIRTDDAGLDPLGEMLRFLRTVSGEPGPALADIGFIDDGSTAAGEVMNLLVRYNLLFRIVPSPDRRLKLNVRFDPLADASNPGVTAHKIRDDLTDERRTVRIYGSAVVIARATGSASGVRVQLLNYGGAARSVQGIRVRVLGHYPKHTAELLDYTVDSKATEFTLPELKIYAVVDLSR